MSAAAYAGWAGPLLRGQVLKTPGYYYSVEVMAEDMRALKAALGTPLVMKLAACPLPEVLSRLPEDVRVGVISASRPEMNMVIAWATDHAYLHALNLDPQLARAVLGAGHRVIVETPRQVTLLAELRGRREVKPLVLGLAPEALGLAGGGHRGLDRAGVFAAVEAAVAAGIAVGGVALLRRARFAADEALATLPALAALVAEIEARTPAPLATAMLGEWTGGLDDADGLAAYRAALGELPPHLLALHEAGEAAFARGGVFLTRVVDGVASGERQRVICDASLASAFLLSQAAGEHRRGGPLQVLHAADGAVADGTCQATVVGESGLDGDRFGVLPGPLAAGDLLVIPDAGAWCRTYAPAALQGLGGAPSFLLGQTGVADA